MACVRCFTQASFFCPFCNAYEHRVCLIDVIPLHLFIVVGVHGRKPCFHVTQSQQQDNEKQCKKVAGLVLYTVHTAHCSAAHQNVGENIITEVHER